MNCLYANLASLRRGSRSNNQAAIAMFNKFQAKPLRKATRYDSVASKIAPDIQPPIAMPASVDDNTKPTRLPAFGWGITFAHNQRVGRHNTALDEAEHRGDDVEGGQPVGAEIGQQRGGLQRRTD